MPGPADDLPLSLQELRAAVTSGDLPALVTRLVSERGWEALGLLYGYAGCLDGPAGVGLPLLEASTQALDRALAAAPAARNARAAQADGVRAVRLAAAEALLARAGGPPFTEPERHARRRAAALLRDAGDHARAATLYEDLGDHARAAECWGALGELDRMEASHARDEAHAGRRRAAADALRQFELHLTGGERRLAVAAVADLPDGAENASEVRRRAADIEARLVRGRGVTLRVRGGQAVRAAALPARLGRDPLCEVTLRDPGVSRHHASIRADDGGLVIEDAGSRGGLSVGGARVDGPLRLNGESELMLGATTSLRLRADDAGRLVIRGISGLDRDLLALVGRDPLDLSVVIEGGQGLALVLDGGGARLVRRPDIAVRVGGHFVGAGCDLLHGDLIEVLGATPLAIEVD
jgi:hypothetical protein